MTNQFNIPNQVSRQIYRYTISEGDEYFDMDIDTYFELDVYHTTRFTPLEFNHLISTIISDDTFYITDIIRKLCVNYGFFTIDCEVCVHIEEGNSLQITHPDPADEDYNSYQ